MMKTPDAWLQDPAVRLLRDYVRVDTSNPPGNERRGAEFLKAYLDCEGIPSELVCSEKERCNLYSRLSGREHNRAVVLLNHIDVVPAYAPFWTKPPFEGVIHNGYLYGRGTYDMKSTGIAQLLAYVDLAHSGLPLTRDVIFLGECGEETFGTDGASWIFEHRPELFAGVNCVLNEGGYNEVVTGEIRYWGLEVAQSGFAFTWLTADNENALKRPEGFHDLGLYVPPSPIVARYLDDVADFRSHYFSKMFRNPELIRSPEVRRWIPFQNLSLLTGGIWYWPPFPSKYLSGFNFGGPWAAAVALSIPMDVSPRPYLDAVLAEAHQKGLKPEGTYCGPPGMASPYPTPDTEALRRVIEAANPRLPFIPIVNAFMSSTAVEFRKRGIPAYGFTPIHVGPTDAARRHGNDERILLPFYVRAIPVMREALFELASEAGGTKKE
jgi:acetylornithine deacetylase/succinyl-diaminopimelate desuccinylase-like protein